MGFELWGHKLMGIPEMDSLPPYYIMSNRFFMLSLLFKIIFFFLFTYIIVFSFYRAIRKSIQIEQQIVDKDKQNVPGQNIKQTQQTRINKKKNGVLISQKNQTKNFQDDEQKQEQKQQINQNDSSSGQQEQQSGSESDKSQEEKQVKNQSQQQIATKIRLFTYQQGLLKLAPWCFIYVFTLNTFTIDYISIIAIFFTIITYLIFNMFNVAASYPMLKNLFMIGVFAGFIPYFINNQDFTV